MAALPGWLQKALYVDLKRECSFDFTMAISSADHGAPYLKVKSTSIEKIIYFNMCYILFRNIPGVPG